MLKNHGLTGAMLKARRERHRKNVSDAFAAAKRGETICLSALMCGGAQTGAELMGGAATIDNNTPLASDNWKVEVATSWKSA